MYTQEEAKRLRKQFWILFGKRCKAVPELQERKKKWMLYDTKITGLDLKFEVNRTSASVMIELNHRNENKRLDLFEKLQKYRPIIEDGFTDGLKWDFLYVRDSGEEICRIYTELEGVDIHRQKQWPDIFNFFIENMLQLENNFLDIRDALKEENSHY